jgi:hypothetical protein
MTPMTNVGQKDRRRDMSYATQIFNDFRCAPNLLREKSNHGKNLAKKFF